MNLVDPNGMEGKKLESHMTDYERSRAGGDGPQSGLDTNSRGLPILLDPTMVTNAVPLRVTVAADLLSLYPASIAQGAQGGVTALSPTPYTDVTVGGLSTTFSPDGVTSSVPIYSRGLGGANFEATVDTQGVLEMAGEVPAPQSGGLSVWASWQARVET